MRRRRGGELRSGGRQAGRWRRETRFARLEAGLSDVKATLARFEAVLDQVSKDLTGFRSDLASLGSDLTGLGSEGLAGSGASLAGLEARASRLPSAIQMVGFVLALLAIAGVARVITGP